MAADQDDDANDEITITQATIETGRTRSAIWYACLRHPDVLIGGRPVGPHDPALISRRRLLERLPSIRKYRPHRPPDSRPMVTSGEAGHAAD